MGKICVLTTVHPANDARIYFKEICSLIRAGFDVCYLAKDAESLKDERLRKINIKSYAGRRKRMFAFFGVWRFAVRQDAWIYHIHDPELIVCGLLLKLVSRKRVIYDAHEDYPGYIRQKEYLKKWLRLPVCYAMAALERLAAVFFDFIFTADDGVSARFPKRKTKVLYNFPDLKAFQISKEPPEKEYDLIYPGSVSRAIAENMLKTVKQARDEGHSMKALFVSNYKFSGGKDWIRKRMAEEGIGDECLILKDRVPYGEVALLTEKSKVGFIPLPDTPKFQNNIPTKLFEYMYCGIPVLSTDLKPARSFVENRGCAVFVDIKNAQETAEAAIDLLTNEEKRARMGEIGRRLVVEEYNWENEEKKLIGAYTFLMSKDRGKKWNRNI